MANFVACLEVSLSLSFKSNEATEFIVGVEGGGGKSSLLLCSFFKEQRASRSEFQACIKQ